MSPDLRRAAILLVSLDPPTAERVLRSMSRTAAVRLSRAASRLGPVGDQERTEACGRAAEQMGSERMGAEQMGAEQMGAEQMGAEQMGKAHGRRSEAVGTSGIIASTDGRPSPTREAGDEDVRRGPGELPHELLAAALQCERPQVIAVLLSLRPPAEAGKILGLLGEDQQSEVLARIGDMQPVDSQLAQQLETQLQQRLAALEQQQRRQQAARSKVQAILASSGAGEAALAEAEAGYVEEAESPGARESGLERRRLTFADLRQLDEDALRLVVRAVGARTMRVAVLDADTEFARRLTALLPRRSRPMGPLMLADIERAQQQVAEAAAQLIDQGAIVLAGGARLAAAA